MTVSVERELGDLAARMKHVEAAQKEQGQQLSEVLKILTAAQGGWKVLVIVGVVAATIGGIIARVLSVVWPS